jgi:hypothetical protein
MIHVSPPSEWKVETLNIMKLRHLLPALLLGALPLASHAALDVSITVAPPVLPVYEQPPCPVDGDLWTPGYYAYGDAGYYFVPGVWVAPPQVGVLWTPGYWGFNNGIYAFNEGYWGPTVGFYGGINYGFGYGGEGYYGGRWDGGHFRYNTAVTRVNTSVIHNTYSDRSALQHQTQGRSSFNGPGGVNARPTAAQQAAARQSHIPPTKAQMSHRQESASHSRAVAGGAAAGRRTNAESRTGTRATAGAQASHPQTKAASHPAARTARTEAPAHTARTTSQHTAAPRTRAASPAAQHHTASQAPHHAAPQARRAAPQPHKAAAAPAKKKETR